MADYAAPISRVIEELKRLPGIGQKTAQRLAYGILRKSKEEVEQLAQSLLELKQKIKYCSLCNNLTDTDPCNFCTNPNRTNKTICVVEAPNNIITIERTREFKGRYHVLHGAISPIDGIGPDDLKLKTLLDRIRTGQVQEVIIATNPNIEGEATAVYISKLIKPLGIKVSRIALGIPVGSDLEFADEVTMSKALEGRREL